MIDRSDRVRTDLPYLRRRIKPAPTPEPTARPARAADAPIDLSRPGRPAPTPVRSPAPAPTAAPAGAGLDLSRPARGSGAPAPDATTPATVAGRPPAARRGPVAPSPFPAPGIDGLRLLDDDEPVLRLDARRSAVGSLVVSGAAAVFWESEDLVTGSATIAGERIGSVVVTPGNRELVGFEDEGAVVALRRLGLLRRALFVGDAEQLVVRLFDGSTVAVSTGDAERMHVLSLLRIGPFIELRAEPFRRPVTLDGLQRAFGFEPTADVRPHVTRGR